MKKTELDIEICPECGGFLIGDNLKAECESCGLIAELKKGKVITYYDNE